MAHAPRTAIPTQLGLALTVMLGFDRYLAYPLACLDVWTRPPAMLGQIAFFYSAAGDPVGYATWAFLASDVAARLCSEADVRLHLSEWNEGAELWIMDMALPPGLLATAIADLAQRFAQVDSVRFLRRREDGSVRTVSLWRRDRGAAMRRYGWSLRSDEAQVLPC